MRDPKIDEIRAELGIDEAQGWDSLYDILRAFPSLCDRAGVNPAHVARCPETAITSIGVGLAVVGKMMTNLDTAKELNQHDITSLGYLLVTMAELIAPLQDIERECERASK